MADSYRRQSALASLGLAARATAAPGEAGAILCERPFRDQLDLRGDGSRKRFRDAVEGAIGVAPPRAPNTVARAGDLSCLWLGPDEWLIVAPSASGALSRQALETALAGQAALVSEVSDSRAVIGLGGIRAREVLEKGCTIDLHPRAFAADRCAQTLIAKAHVLLHQLDDAPSYDIYVHRSFAEYLWAWLEDASLEYGLAVVAG